MKFSKKFLVTIFVYGVIFSLVGCGYASSGTYLEQRKMRVEHYRRTTNFKEDVLRAILEVPREFFVPKNERRFTYEEYPLPIGYGQTITDMWFVTYMTNLLRLKPTDSVLEIGSGSGYQASVLYQITKKVYSIEIIPQLAKQASHRWRELGYHIQGKTGDGYYGWAKYAPYDKIIVTCAADHVPVYLLRQLKPGGILLIPVGNPFARQTLLLIRKKSDGGIKTQRLRSCKFVPFTGKMLEKYKYQRKQEKATREKMLKSWEKHPTNPPLPEAEQKLMKIHEEMLSGRLPFPGSFQYKVKSGDFLYKIANKFHTTVDLIVKMNKLENIPIKPGDKLTLVPDKFSIEVDLSKNLLYLYYEGKFFKVYPIATGTDDKTPVGEFKITDRLKNPVWYSNKGPIPPNSPENLLGSRWLGINAKGIGIHEAINPGEIGKYVTAGCIRMLKKDVDELYMLVVRGTPVKIKK